MDFYISTFNNIRYFSENCIPISTCHSDPKFFHQDSYNKKICFIDKHNVFNGIREESLSPNLNIPENLICSSECKNRGYPDKCVFLEEYENEINKIDFNYLLSEFSRVAEDVRKITHYDGEPNIILLVYEKEDNPCSERHAIKRLFNKNGFTIKEFNKNDFI